MAQATAMTLLQRMRRRLRPAQPDFADHGTAFGLELSLTDVPSPVGSLGSTPRRRPWWKARAPAVSRTA